MTQLSRGGSPVDPDEAPSAVAGRRVGIAARHKGSRQDRPGSEQVDRGMVAQQLTARSIEGHRLRLHSIAVVESVPDWNKQYYLKSTQGDFTGWFLERSSSKSRWTLSMANESRPLF